MRGMEGSTRDILWTWAVAFGGGALFAMPQLPAGIRWSGVAIPFLVCAVLLWSFADIGAPWIVYYARTRSNVLDGSRVIYVGVTGPREGSAASLSERITEHVRHDVEDRPWKALIEPGNCTVARRCWTRWGALRSERRRIRALAAWGRTPVCPPLRNDVHNRRRMLPLAAMLWLYVESRIVPEACFHRPAKWVHDNAADLGAEVVDRRPAYVPDDDEFGFFRAVAESVRPGAGPEPADDGGADDVAYTDEQIDAMFSAWESELSADLSSGPDEDNPGMSQRDTSQRPGSGEGPKGPASDSTGRGTWDVGQPGTSGSEPGDGDAGCDGPETVENGDRSAWHGGDARSAHPAGSGGFTGRQPEGGTSERQCCEEGCTEAAEKGPRCPTHRRSWEAERKRKRRQGGDQ